MNTPSEQLERLISRFLDHEASAADKQALNTVLANDERARALFEEYVALDREAGYALRDALHGRVIPLRRRSWGRSVRALGLAAAACLAAAVWLHRPAGAPRAQRTHQADLSNGSSWFYAEPGASPAGALPETLERLHYAQPGVGVRNLRRDWIVVPGKSRNEFLLIQIDRSATRLITFQQDF